MEVLEEDLSRTIKLAQQPSGLPGVCQVKTCSKSDGWNAFVRRVVIDTFVRCRRTAGLIVAPQVCDETMIHNLPGR